VLKRKDSTFFYAQLESIAVQVNGSAVIRTILTDVTERKQVEWKQKHRESQLRQVHEGQMVDEALRRSEEEFRVLAEHVPDVIERFDAGMRHVYVNPAGLRLRGKELDNIIGRTIREIGVPEPYCTFREDALRMVFATGEVSQVESNFQTVGGNGMRFYQSILVPEYDHEGNIAFVLVVSRDITERKSAEEALLTSQIHLSEAMDLAKIVYWELDSATRTFTLNDAFYTFYGTTAEQEGGYRMAAEEYFKRFVHPDDRAMVRQLAEENNSGKDPEFLVDLEHRIIRRDGEVRHILARTRGLRDVVGRITRCYGANQDITRAQEA
jgi:PAS domain S-box-containing protein